MIISLGVVRFVMSKILKAAGAGLSSLALSAGAMAATVTLTVPDNTYTADFSDVYSNIATVGGVVVGAVIAVKVFSWLKAAIV